MNDLRALLNALDANADLAARHVWLVRLFKWFRGDGSSPEASISRLQTFIVAVQTHPELETRLKAWWQKLVQTVDATTLLADFGFAPRTAFVSELAERLRKKMLPGTPETIDGAELFTLVAPSRFDAQWLSCITEPQIDALTALLCADPAADALRPEAEQLLGGDLRQRERDIDRDERIDRSVSGHRRDEARTRAGGNQPFPVRRRSRSTSRRASLLTDGNGERCLRWTAR